MSKVCALVTADWHVRKFDRVWYRRDTLRGDTSWGIKQVCKIAQEYSVPCVLLLGDLFDQKLQQSDALQAMREALDEFQRADRAVYYVQGQHERSSPPILSAMHQWPAWIDGQIVTLPGGMTMTGLDYQSPKDVEAAMKSCARTDILATHQVWRDFMGEDRGDAWLHWSQSQCVLTGDYHKSFYRQEGRPHVLSPGSLCMQSIQEDPKKYVYILYDDMSAKQVQFPTRGYFEARIHDEAELEKFLDTWHQHPARMPKQGVPPELMTNIIRVYYRENISGAFTRLTARIAGDAHLFVKQLPVEAPEPVGVDAAERIETVLSGGLVGCVRRYYAEDKAVCGDAVRLAEARDSRLSDTIFSIYKEKLGECDSERKRAIA
jgi:predicted phosphodiesterase